MKKIFLPAGLLMLVVGSTQAGDLYRWVDKSGKVHYGDAPAAEAVQVEKKKLGDHPSEDAGLSYEARRAKESFPVTLYVADNCGEPCRSARELLNKRGIPFTEKNLKSNEEIDAFKKASGGDDIPALAIGKTWLKRFVAEQWNDELDAAGYPRASPNPAAKNKQY